jgi:hypothetical protein
MIAGVHSQPQSELSSVLFIMRDCLCSACGVQFIHSSPNLSSLKTAYWYAVITMLRELWFPVDRIFLEATRQQAFLLSMIDQDDVKEHPEALSVSALTLL